MEQKLPTPFDNLDLDGAFEDKKIVWLLVEDNGTGTYPAIRGVYLEEEYNQAVSNANAAANLYIIGVNANERIKLEEIAHVED